jgi:hypothetical protein
MAAVLEGIATAMDMLEIMDVLTKIVEGRGLVRHQNLNAYLKPISNIGELGAQLLLLVPPTFMTRR